MSASAIPLPAIDRLFPYEKWNSRVAELSTEFRSAQPFPYVHLTEFLDPELSLRLSREFPNSNDIRWNHYRHYNENKLGLTQSELFPPSLSFVISEFQSPRFVSWLERVTGIKGLLPDPTMEGGGLHQIVRGGYLNVHADFTRHHHQPHWRRRLNLLLYLNEEWHDDWNGQIELWDREMRGCVKKFAPLINHAVLFETAPDSFHGHPEPLNCPPEVTRKSVTLYYFTLDTSNVPAKSTNYRARPTDSTSQRILMWADKRAVSAYSKVKRHIGLSDEAVSRLLRFSRRG